MTKDKIIKPKVLSDHVLVSISVPNEDVAKIFETEEIANRAIRTYGNKDLQSIAKVTKTQVIHWTSTRAIIPFQDAKGRGKQRKYNFQNLTEAMICREMNKMAVEVRVIKEALDYLRNKVWTFDFELWGHIEDEDIDEEIIEYDKDGKEFVSRTTGKSVIRSTASKKHTFWEFLHLYGLYNNKFYLMLTLDEENYNDCEDRAVLKYKVNIITSNRIETILDSFNFSIFINIKKLIDEAGGINEQFK